METWMDKKLIHAIKKYLTKPQYKIDESDNGYVIAWSDKPYYYPEDCVEVKVCGENIQINEVHREQSRTIAETTDQEKAAIYLYVFCLRFFEPLPKDDNS
jgi:hypothetical protein